MAANDETLYIYAFVQNVLMHKYGFKQIIINNDAIKEYGLFFFNMKDPNYQVIRVTFHTALEFKDEDEEIVDTMIETINKQFKKEFNFLDIHIQGSPYDESYEKYNYLNIYYQFIEGFDVSDIYPDLYKIKEYDEQALLDEDRFKADMKKMKKERNKSIPFFKRDYSWISISLVIICTIIYILEMLLSIKYDESAVFIVMGAEYKTFSIGLHQYWRLLTCCLVHGSILHLVCNMYALFFVGGSLERSIGKEKFIVVFLYSSIMASLTQSILTENTVLLGISGALYGMFVYYILLLNQHTNISWKSLGPMIFLNLCLNFLSTTAWLAHLGGAMGGFIMFLMYEYSHNNDIKPGAIVAAITLLFMIYRYVTIKEINPIYGGTDMEVVKIFSDLGFKSYSASLMKRLLDVYAKFGG